MEKGVKIYNESGVTEFCGEDGIITGVVIKSGEKLQADVVVMGIGKHSFSDESAARLRSVFRSPGCIKKLISPWPWNVDVETRHQLRCFRPAL